MVKLDNQYIDMIVVNRCHGDIDMILIINRCQSKHRDISPFSSYKLISGLEPKRCALSTAIPLRVLYSSCSLVFSTGCGLWLLGTGFGRSSYMRS